jgi:hypothetical protein
MNEDKYEETRLMKWLVPHETLVRSLENWFVLFFSEEKTERILLDQSVKHSFSLAKQLF